MREKESKQTALDMISFIDACPTAAHAVAELSSRFEKAGFKRLDEADSWSVQPGDQLYIVRNHSSILAIRAGSAPLQDAGFRIIGAHTDFPGLRLKPNGFYSKNGYIQLGVEVYGGPILHTWTDRDLGLAGKIIAKTDNRPPEVILFVVRRPVCRIPNLAPHIDPDKKKEGLQLNKQDHLPPVIGIGEEKALEEKPVLKLIAESLGIDPEKISSYSIEIFDIQPGCLGGLNDEFIFVRSFDNLASCHAAMEALLRAPETAFTQVVALFDNEEVGSTTMQGARSGFLDSVLERLCLSSDNPREAFFRALAKSLAVSADGAHAVNPNYPEAHEPKHQPILNGGPVIKVNAQERYTTQIDALEHLKQCAERQNVPLQTFVARTDVGTGSTIGPMTASRLGIKSIDIGSPMISMHSVREMAGTDDQLSMVKLLTEHFSSEARA